MNEMGSTYAKILIETLLNVHALCNMDRASDHNEHRKTAAEWLPHLERGLANLRYELTKE